MSKINVKTTGNFMIVDVTTGYAVPVDKSVEVDRSSFIDLCIVDGRLKETSSANAEAEIVAQVEAEVVEEKSIDDMTKDELADYVKSRPELDEKVDLRLSASKIRKAIADADA